MGFNIAQNCVTIASAGGIAPLITLLASPSSGVQRNAARALSNLGMNDENRVAIATAGGIGHSSRYFRRRLMKSSRARLRSLLPLQRLVAFHASSRCSNHPYILAFNILLQVRCTN